MENITAHAQTSTPSATAKPVTRPGAIARTRGEGEAIWFLDNLLTVKADARDGAAFACIEAALPAGSRTPFHSHQDEDEAWYVLEGEITFFVEGSDGRIGVIRASAGSYVHAPRGVAHGFRTETPVRVLVITGVDGFVEMIREAGGPAQRRELPPLAPPDMARLGAAADHRRIDILGPLPESLVTAG